MIQKLYHVAYRCNNSQETVDFYTKVLGLRFAMAVSQDRVPSTGEETPYIHIFFEMADGSNVAFFELPQTPRAIPDTNTPSWVQHLALEVSTRDDLLKMKASLEEHHIDYIGIVDHGTINSLYFFDPNGHRLEIALRVNEAVRAEREKKSNDVLKAWNAKWHPEYAQQ
ncbi:VOC family protein [Pusillimonas caeni]|uniref:VOC family protein n=1 Tax=Pusillimonas caeni TaxID=1348472 RepID=UPI000E59C179|nr:VOC family protein [Pusillimonas caeni]TFL15797.1 VOC family protein [Pusillimonas caeni]